jgi:hypothetical protein
VIDAISASMRTEKPAAIADPTMHTAHIATKTRVSLLVGLDIAREPTALSVFSASLVVDT